jgi:hypothetical protein
MQILTCHKRQQSGQKKKSFVIEAGHTRMTCTWKIREPANENSQLAGILYACFVASTK